MLLKKNLARYILFLVISAPLVFNMPYEDYISDAVPENSIAENNATETETELPKEVKSNEISVVPKE